MTLHAGGELEAQVAYDEAVHAIFSLHLTRRHMQPYRSEKDGKTKWAMIEMWPMHVSQQKTPAGTDTICCV